MAIKSGPSSWLDEEGGDGSENSPLGVESCRKDRCSMGSGGRDRRKEKEKEDTRTTVSEDNVATVPRQRHQKACWYFTTSRIKSASARIPL